MLVDMGMKWADALVAASSTQRFVETLTARGVPLEIAGDLAVKLPSGPTRSDNPRSVERSERRRKLRDLGLTPAQAGRYGQGPGVFALALRRLEKGIPL